MRVVYYRRETSQRSYIYTICVAASPRGLGVSDSYTPNMSVVDGINKALGDASSIPFVAIRARRKVVSVCYITLRHLGIGNYFLPLGRNVVGPFRGVAVDAGFHLVVL